jgi:nucleoside-diphosphate-sugar epimerase
VLDLDGKRVFVAGGTGLAGSAVVRALLASSARVQVIVPHRSREGAFEGDPRISYVSADLREAADCQRACEGCDLAVMAAAITGGAAASASVPWAQVTDNVVMDARLYQAMHDNGVKRVVYISTASVYQPLDGHIREDDLDWNLDPAPAHLGVGWAKRFGERAGWFWHQKTGMEVVILRLANVFGPYAKFDPAVSNVVPALVRKAVDRADPFEVWGDPGVTRDVIFADDFGAASVAALRADHVGYDVFNVGSGVRTTVGELAQWALEAAGHAPVDLRYGKSAPESLAFRALDVSKANQKLGWTPQVSIPEGVRRTVQWWEGNRATWGR